MAAGERPPPPHVASPGNALAWVAGLVFALSAFMGWYSFETELATLSVIGWNTGTLGKLVFFCGLAVLLLLFLEATGLDLSPSVPAGAVVSALGTIGTIFVLIRLIDVPDRLAGSGRAVGIWIALVAGLAIVASGLLKANEEL